MHADILSCRFSTQLESGEDVTPYLQRLAKVPANGNAAAAAPGDNLLVVDFGHIVEFDEQLANLIENQYYRYSVMYIDTYHNTICGLTRLIRAQSDLNLIYVLEFKRLIAKCTLPRPMW